MMKNVFFLLAMVACFFAGCSEGDEPVAPNQKPEINTPAITLDSSIQTSGLSFDTSTSEKSINFTTTSDWTLSIAETRNGTSWCTASPTSGGKGTATVKFTTTENTEPEDRSVAVTIKSGAISKTFMIIQKGAETLLVSTKRYEVAQEGNSIELEVKANIEYQIEISESAKNWISENQTRSLKLRKHSFIIAPNEEIENREGEIYIKSSDKKETVKVFQFGGAILLVKHGYIVSPAGATICAEINSNVEFGVQMPDVNWVTEDVSSRAMSSHSLYYEIARNNTYENRFTYIVFYDKNSELKDTLKIEQLQNDAIILSQKEYKIDKTEKTIEVSLSSNIDFEVLMPDIDWIRQVESRTLSDSTLFFNILENTTSENRSAKIPIVNKLNRIEETISIEQRGNLDMHLITNTEAGELKGIDLSSYDGLKLIGDLNGTDINVLRTTWKGSVIDLSEANIVSGGELYNPGFPSASTKDNTISWGFFGNSESIEEIILPKNLESIESSAFYEFKNLWKIVLPESLKKIEYNAFRGCSNLVSINIPNSVEEIASCAFGECEKITSINIPNGIKVIEDNSFRECKALKQINIPNSVEEIKGSAFRGCESIKSLYIPNSVEKIGKYAFDECKNLISIEVASNNLKYDSRNNCNALIETETNTLILGCGRTTIPNSIETINDNAFSWNNTLTKIEIPNSVKTIKSATFYWCSNLEEVILPEGLEQIETQAFENCHNLLSICIPNTVTEIKQMTFQSCHNLRKITIPNTIKNIGFQAFLNCAKLKKLIIPEGVEVIGGNAFSGCTDLFEITISNTVRTIGDCAFNGCRSLTSISIPKGVNAIGEKAFANCVKLESVYCYYENPIKINHNVFINRENIVLYIPKGTKDNYNSTNGWSGFKEIIEMDE